MPYVASTLANDNTYVEYSSAVGNGANRALRGITIRGGSGVASKKSALAGHVLTPDGVVTKVSDDDLEFLQKDEVFCAHLKAGHLKVMKMNAAPAKAAKDMDNGDASRPIIPGDARIQGVEAGKKQII